MLMKLAFLKKQNEQYTLNLNSNIKSILNEVLTITENNKITSEELDVLAHFEIKKNILILESNLKPSRSAIELTQIYNKIVKGPHRKDYYIVLIADGASKYYIEKIVPLNNFFERQIRELIYLVMLNEFGMDWIGIVNSDIRDDLKSRKIQGDNLIENGLNELTLSQLETLLFTEYPNLTPDELLLKISVSISSNNIDIESIHQMILDNTPESLWNRLFEGSVEIKDLKSKLSEVRGYRNIIAHNKTFHSHQYMKCRALLKDINNQLESAIYKVENDRYNHIEFTKTLSEILDGFSRSYKDLLDSLTPSFEGISAACLKLGEIAKSFNTPNYYQESLDLLRSMSQISLEPLQNISTSEVPNKEIDEGTDHEDF